MSYTFSNTVYVDNKKKVGQETALLIFIQSSYLERYLE